MERDRASHTGHGVCVTVKGLKPIGRFSYGDGSLGKGKIIIIMKGEMSASGAKSVDMSVGDAAEKFRAWNLGEGCRVAEIVTEVKANADKLRVGAGDHGKNAFRGDGGVSVLFVPVELKGEPEAEGFGLGAPEAKNLVCFFCGIFGRGRVGIGVESYLKGRQAPALSLAQIGQKSGIAL